MTAKGRLRQTFAHQQQSPLIPPVHILGFVLCWGFFPLQSAECCSRGLFKEMEINKILIELQSEFDSLKISIIYNLHSWAGGNDSYLRSTSG